MFIVGLFDVSNLFNDCFYLSKVQITLLATFIFFKVFIHLFIFIFFYLSKMKIIKRLGLHLRFKGYMSV